MSDMGRSPLSHHDGAPRPRTACAVPFGEATTSAMLGPRGAPWSPPTPFEARWAPTSRRPRRWCTVRESCIGVALAKQDYAAPNGKIQFREGDMLTIHKRQKNGWCIAANTSGSGRVPEHLIEFKFMREPTNLASEDSEGSEEEEEEEEGKDDEDGEVNCEERLEMRKRRLLHRISQQQLSLNDFTDMRSLYDLLEPPSAGELAPAALLRGEWLLQRAAAMREVDRPSRIALQLPRRQDLERDEPAAYIGALELDALPCGDLRIGFARPVICVSYCWHGREHPDPYGDNLLALADAIEERAARDEAPQSFAVFLDWCSLHQRGEGGAERSALENRAFSIAISRMQLWYAHQKTLVYMLTETPPMWHEGAGADEQAPVPYAGRGWPCFERMVTMLLKLQSSKCWSTIVDVGEPDRKVQPPKTADGFAELVRTKTFTNGADIDVVIALYRETMHSALGQVTSLRYAGLRWGDAEMAELVQVLPYCERLEGLNLKGSHNRYTEESAKMLAEALADPRFLPRLSMLGVGCRNKEEEADETLLYDPRLLATCQERGIRLARDVPIDAVLPGQQGRRPAELARHRSSIQSDALTQRRRGRQFGDKTQKDLRQTLEARMATGANSSSSLLNVSERSE